MWVIDSIYNIGHASVKAAILAVIAGLFFFLYARFQDICFYMWLIWDTFSDFVTSNTSDVFRFIKDKLGLMSIYEDFALAIQPKRIRQTVEQRFDKFK